MGFSNHRAVDMLHYLRNGILDIPEDMTYVSTVQ